MKRLNAVVTLSVTLSLVGCYPSVRGNGDPVIEVRSIEGFSGVECAGTFDVRVEQAETFSVAVHMDSNLVPLVRTWVTGGVLQINSHDDLETHLPGPHVIVRMPDVTSASLSGSGHIAVVNPEKKNPVALRLSGSGYIDFTGNAPSIDVSLDGSGEVNLAGATDRLALDLDGSGAIDAASLPAQTAFVELSGSGNVRATVNGPARVALRGSGDIDLYGDVALESSTKSGSGAIRVH